MRLEQITRPRLSRIHNPLTESLEWEFTDIRTFEVPSEGISLPLDYFSNLVVGPEPAPGVLLGGSEVCPAFSPRR